MNNAELIKIIAQYVHSKHQLPKGIKGYEKSVLQDTVDNMISKKVIFEAEVKTNTWEVDSNNRSKQYKKMMYCINKELLKTEYEVDEFKK